MKFLAGIAFAVATLFATVAEAEIKLLFDGPTDNNLRVGIISGEFEPNDDPALLEAFIQSNQITAITFNSPGGNPTKAMEYGRMIRKLGLNTIQFRKLDCASACAFAFMGGSFRYAEPGAIGVHKTYFGANSGVEQPQAVSSIQGLIADFVQYFNEMGINPGILEIILSVEGDDIRYLTKSEMAKYNINSNLDETKTAANETPAAPAMPAAPPAASIAPNADDEAIKNAYVFPYVFYNIWEDSKLDLVGFVGSFYNDNVFFYGKEYTASQIYSEKQAIVTRWPVRAYAVRDDSITYNCDNRACTSSAIVDWYVGNPAKQKLSSGASKFTFVIDRKLNKIIGEDGSVVERDTDVKGPDRIIRMWNLERERCTTEAPTTSGKRPACYRQELITKKLDAVGFCFGRPNEPEESKYWHLCGW